MESYENEDGERVKSPKAVFDAQFECMTQTGEKQTYDLDTPYELSGVDFAGLSQLKCQPLNSALSSYTLVLDDTQAGVDCAAPDILQQFGKASGSIDFSIEVHKGALQLGNAPIEPKKAIDWFTATQEGNLRMVGPEDLVILDEVPAIRELLKEVKPEGIQEKLDNMFANSEESPKTHTVSTAQESNGNAEVILSVETQSLGQPFSVTYGGDQYTIHPDHHIV